jgi:hypothetical protein
VELNAMSQVDDVFSYGWLFWMFKTYVPLMLLQPKYKRIFHNIENYF